MPLVVLQHKAGRVLEDMLAKLSQAMPEIVASALTVEGVERARLTSNDIEVRVRESEKFDVNTKDLEIIIWANSYAERLCNLDERKDMIVKAIRTFLADYDRNLSGYVWVLLQPGEFGEL